MKDHHAAKTRQKIAKLSWDKLETSLAAPSATRSTPSSTRELKEYFGAEEFEALRSLAAHAQRSRQRDGAVGLKGNLVLLPGIMGSELTAFEGTRQDTI